MLQAKPLVPKTPEELAEMLRQTRASVRIRGTERDAVAGDIVMQSLNRLVLYEPGEMIIQVEAGMTLTELDRILANENQWIPTLQPTEDLSTTVGGALSLDLYHPRARNTMSLRTTILGGTFCTARGELFKSGSRVVKSVAGYDTHRAFVGARGALGAIVEVTLRVLPRPESIVRFCARGCLLREIREHRPSVLESAGDELLVEYAGYQEDFAEAIQHLERHPVQHYPQDEWSAAIREIRRDYIASPVGQGERALFERVQHALDPEGVLRHE